jgi:hypothetical protein
MQVRWILRAPRRPCDPKKVAQAPVSGPAEFGQGGDRKGDLTQRWVALLDEALEPANSGTFIPPVVCFSHHQSEVEGLSEVEAAQPLPGVRGATVGVRPALALGETISSGSDTRPAWRVTWLVARKTQASGAAYAPLCAEPLDRSVPLHG